MTFEEAIRALQRANTKARLKPTPKPATPAAAPARADGKPAQSAEPPTDAPEPAAAAEPASSDAAPGRSAVGRGHPGRRTCPHPAALGGSHRQAGARRRPGGAACTRAGEAIRRRGRRASRRSSRPRPTALTDAIKAAMSAGTVRGVEPACADRPPPRPTARPLQPPRPAYRPEQPAWTPPPGAKAAAGTSAAAAPASNRHSRPGRSPPARAPTPTVAAAAARRSVGLSQPPPRARPGRSPASSAPRGHPWPTAATPRRRLRRRERPGAERARTAPRGGGHAEKGLLVEAVPRRMRVGVPAPAEVRIARDRIEGLIATLNGRGAAPPGEPPLTRALSVRLRAPGGDFWIEPATPETQWVDSASEHDPRRLRELALDGGGAPARPRPADPDGVGAHGRPRRPRGRSRRRPIGSSR